MIKNKFIKRRQKKLKRKYARLFKMNLLIVMIMMVIEIMTVELSGNNKSEGEILPVVYESKERNDHKAAVSPANVSTDMILTENDKYLLAKIAMAEAEGESLETKVLVISTILNRVESEQFPDTVEEVIFQKVDGVYQFSPVIPGGRWYNVEPNEECWEVVQIVTESKGDLSKGALYFEACSGESWHSRNLEFICESDNTRFYK